MIYELERYMKSLSKTTMDLQNTKKQAMEMSELAIKDSLTGIRNKTGYDKEVQKLEWEISSGLKDFGVAMIDLNFLKRINDTYGHDKGNIGSKLPPQSDTPSMTRRPMFLTTMFSKKPT